MDEYLKEHLMSMQEKLDGLDNRLNDIQIVQAEQAKDIETHIARTDLLQKIVEPLYERYQQLMGALKVLGFVLIALGGLETVLAIKKYLLP